MSDFFCTFAKRFVYEDIIALTYETDTHYWKFVRQENLPYENNETTPKRNVRGVEKFRFRRICARTT